MDKIRWGILSTAKIGREKVTPAMQQGKFCSVEAIASREKKSAEEVAKNLGIAKAYGSYEELLADTNVNAVYIPLPNHMHVEWAIKAMDAGKHVLCEKPIGMNAAEAKQLQDAARKHPQLKIMEAFMYRFHPQWQHAKKIVDEGKLGELKTVESFFSYNNTDLKNIRNQRDAGGGAMMDIGCYCVSFARFLFRREPGKVLAMVEYDPLTGTDTLSSGIIDFNPGNSTFTCSTRMMPYQRVNILGSEGRLEIEIPVNAPPEKSMRSWLHSKTGTEEFSFDPVNQYTIQGDAFSKAIIDNTDVPTPLEDAVNNMKLIDAVFESARDGNWKMLS
jgi:predicted dehydrogenase